MLIDNKTFDVVEGLLTHKKLAPLNPIESSELARVQALDVTGFTEADVRAEIIDPILRVLGYKKGEFSSVDREKHIRFLGKKHKYIDYNLTLWRENFWVVEAKRPLTGDKFGYSELSQVIEYSVHPEINAAIVVLCDGVKLEIFDREEDVENAIISFPISSLLDNFDVLRQLLCPMQIWFFYKRRVLRSIDKAFESEFNQKRVNEFFGLIENRFAEKRGQILKNFQSTNFTEKSDIGLMEQASTDDIIDIHYFFAHPVGVMHAMNNNLVQECKSTTDFHVLSKLLPDHYRDANDEFYMNTLSFLFLLEKEVGKIHWAPSWLSNSGDRSIETVIKNLIKFTLSHFEDDEPRKIILLAASTFRRIFKILVVLKPEHRQSGNVRHLLTRFEQSEFSWNQILSSPTANMLRDIDVNTLDATYKFVREFSNNHDFKTNLARQRLSQLWLAEKQMLESEPNYLGLKREIDFGELHPTEHSSVVYDNLGHSCLCIIKSNSKWKQYALEHHQSDILRLNSMGSWAARELIEQNNLNQGGKEQLANYADQFFFGDSNIMEALKLQYWPESK
ncbi:type I restriction enzyme HsdR N-terminal domain-containing protein [Vibrio tasmaniensis]|uniref:type I restriction enzyme HsdR N-terminal domain-containing protein n=1 Tax=Vibrio tasmaniensis TaxID=212663 RepID=UPI0010819AC0|nr:type I restriction enzyme HsdR N-terminal domain-containing protein [Vibrio tasmaniensis]